MDIILYHNPRCSKSRQTLALIEEHGAEFTVVEYLKTPPSHQQLDSILRGLDMEPRDLIRTSQTEYSEQGLDNEELSRDQLIAAMIQTPILIERPILVAGNQVAIGRPPENAAAILP